MSKHFKVEINEFQFFLKLLYAKAKVLKDSLSEKTVNLQSWKEEGYVELGVNSQDCEI
jgi:hypothetical protein